MFVAGVGLDGKGEVVFHRRVRRITLAQLVEKLAPCVIGMEACCGAHHLGRQFAALGHTVRLMPPEYVKCYVKAQKNDDRDAEGIAEAATRPTMRFVTLKSEEQLDIQSLHRTRDRLGGERTALINQLRAVLFERGLVIPKGRTKLDRWLREELPNARGLSPRMQKLVSDMMLELREIDTRITAFDREFAELSRTDETMRSLLSIPGVGVINSTAIGAAIGDGSAFAKGRDFAAWLGLVPRQVTTRGKPRLVGITKRGSSYLRILLIHGARSALPSLAKSETRLGSWLRALLERVKRNVVVVALANKLARIIWAVARSARIFDARLVAA
jgi:transposase